MEKRVVVKKDVTVQDESGKAITLKKGDVVWIMSYMLGEGLVSDTVMVSRDKDYLEESSKVPYIKIAREDLIED